MNVVIFNGSLKHQTQLGPIQVAIEQEFKSRNMKTDSFVMNQIKIISCTGCFKCWDTTPGICTGVKGDAGEEIKKKVVNCDLMVLLTPITFGGYSSELKKIIERLLGTLHPGVQIIDGETHHLKRYDSYPSILAIGISENSDEDEEELFKTLIYRHSLNFYPPVYKTHIIKKDEEVRQDRIKQMIDEMELKK
ncbi:MAG: flavodoxin family protein [Candidatus Heimdallarchaeota archaeon]|nr:flavodoxin family protein [Candidatus Heimdallarchaeota archaeon]MBY8993918.1 flavodoxin family protein [Candidatus Heimdallarchaeota archaeon]